MRVRAYRYSAKRVWNAVVNRTPRRRAQPRAAIPSGPSVEMCNASGAKASIRRASLRPGSSDSRMSG